MIEKLQIFVEAWNGRAMEWGASDCGCMADDLAMSVFGVTSPMGAKSYTTPAGAMKHMRKAGFASLSEAMDAFATRIPLATAMPGDVIAFPSGDDGWGESLGLMVSQRRALVIDPASNQWSMIGDVMTGLAAWRIAQCRK